MEVADFYLDEEKLETGARMELEDAAGRATDHWLSLLFIHSDEAQARIAAFYRDKFDAGKRDESELEAEAQAIKDRTPRDLTREIQHLLVYAWSFDTECTPEAVAELFRRNPAIAIRVVQRVQNQRFFLPDAGPISSDGPKQSSDSSGRTKAKSEEREERPSQSASRGA